jgi:hypothetical protein
MSFYQWYGGCCASGAFLSRKAKEEQKMKSIEVKQRLTYWQWVFLQSKVNGASYSGKALPGQVWAWPKDTYLQRRLQHHQSVSQNVQRPTQKAR